MLMSHLDNEVYSWQDLSNEQPPSCSEDAGARKSFSSARRPNPSRFGDARSGSSRVTRSWQGKQETKTLNTLLNLPDSMCLLEVRV